MNQDPKFEPTENEDQELEPRGPRDWLDDEPEFDPSATTQELIAYLDGEQSPEEALRIEQRLNEDPHYLAEMQSLQRVWDAFDRITPEDAGSKFVKTTMELVVADVRNKTTQKTPRSYQWIKRFTLALVPLILVGVSYAATRYVTTQPHRQLTQNLAMIENLDRYLMVKLELDILIGLEQRRLFSENELFSVTELADLERVVGRLEQATPKRVLTEDPTDYLASLGQAEIQRLKTNYDNFSKLTPAERIRLNAFHQSILNHPRRDQLFAALDSYYTWLVSLGVSEKAQLLDLEPNKQLLEIARIRSQQNRTALGRDGATKLPLDRDEDHLLNWFDLTIKSNESLIRREFPKIVAHYQQEAGEVIEIPPDQLARFAQQAPIKQLVAVLIRIDREFIQDLIVQDVDLLRRGLSYEAQVIIADQAPADQKELVLNWIETANQAKATIPQEKLQEFYELLPAEKRDQLDRMSLEEWTAALSRMYRERNVLIRVEDIENMFLGDF